MLRPSRKAGKTREPSLLSMPNLPSMHAILSHGSIHPHERVGQALVHQGAGIEGLRRLSSSTIVVESLLLDMKKVLSRKINGHSSANAYTNDAGPG